MRAHIVLAHPEPRSFNAHLAEQARIALLARGWQVTLSDLYALDFDPAEKAAHYTEPVDAARFDAQTEQRHASDSGTLPQVVRDEIDRLDRADLVILQYPMWWHLPPAMLKGWLDRVLVYGEVYQSKKRFENGRFVSKRALQSLTVATSAETYAYNGRSADIDLLLWPVNFTLAYVGFEVLRPFVGYGVESGLRYSDDSVVEARLKGIVGDLEARLQSIENESPLPFNRMSDWGADGRIKAGAPAFTPFMRHREKLEIE